RPRTFLHTASSSYPSFFFFLNFRRLPRSTLFPTRRSSDLGGTVQAGLPGLHWPPGGGRLFATALAGCGLPTLLPGRSTQSASFEDRKSTRLNSSHDQISYAVFCLKKKK